MKRFIRYIEESNGHLMDIRRGDKISFTVNRLDKEPYEVTGTVVGSEIGRLRVRDEEGRLYKVKHDDAKLIEEALSEDGETCPIISVGQMKAFEKFVDRMFERFGIDFQFTKHFRERMSDDRNDPCIDIKELAQIIQKIYKKQGKSLKGVAGAEAVVKDIQTDLNIPVAVKYDQKNDEFDIVMKTIMRKKNFRTPNKIIKYK